MYCTLDFWGSDVLTNKVFELEIRYRTVLNGNNITGSQKKII